MSLSAIFTCLACLQIALALQGSAIGFIVVFVLYAAAVGASETPASSILHASVENRQRSTMLSLRSMIQQLGAALGLVMVGLIADVFSTPVAWITGVVFLIFAVLLTALLARRIASVD